MLNGSDMFLYREGSFFGKMIPDSDCWDWKLTEAMSLNCIREWDNLTGIVALIPFTALIATSFNWFRRHYYRGVSMLVVALIHWKPLALYISPSIIYYLASTTPALIQAFASCFRGGVKIVQVVHVKDSGGCVEVVVATTPQSNSQLDKDVCMYVKLCVPSISLVWHSFTVYKHPADSRTVRFLVGPVGPFTETLVARLSYTALPIAICDGFYRSATASMRPCLTTTCRWCAEASPLRPSCPTFSRL